MAPQADEVAALRRGLEAAADPDRAPAMAAYLKGHFPFLGVATPERRVVSKSFIAAASAATSTDLLDTADALWSEPEREFQHVGVDLLRRWVGRLDATALPRVERLIRTRSWWDTVDALAAHVVGSLVARHPELADEMDRWIDDDDLWVARTAILHQLTYADRCDADRLFGYIDRRCDDTDFFIRKACGWALRQHARHDPDAVRGYVVSRADRLSGLTRREALKHL